MQVDPSLNVKWSSWILRDTGRLLALFLFRYLRRALLRTERKSSLTGATTAKCGSQNFPIFRRSGGSVQAVPIVGHFGPATANASSTLRTIKAPRHYSGEWQTAAACRS